VNKLIKTIVFLFGMICFIHFSYGHDEPETAEQVGSQLKSQAYSAGEKNFNRIAFGITEESVEAIKSLMEKNGIGVNSPTDKGHADEVVVGVTVFVCNGEMIYCSVAPHEDHNTVIKRINKDCIKGISNYYDYSLVERVLGNESLKKSHDRYNIMTMSQEDQKGLEIAPEIYEIISKIVGNIKQYATSEYMSMSFAFYYDDSEFKVGLDWHRDWWVRDGRNPNILAFAVLDVTLPAENNVRNHAQIKLGLIDKKYQNQYLPKGLVLERFSPDYEHRLVSMGNNVGCIRGIQRLGVYSLEDNNCVRRLIELDNYTGSGYIVDQSMVINTNEILVHSRDCRKYRAKRLTMIIRCSSFEHENELKEDSSYKKTKIIGDMEKYIAIPSGA